jgi:hypothetical protein
MTKTNMLLEAFQNGEELTAAQITSRYGIRNVYDAVYNLRTQGYAVYLNERTNARGETVNKYRLGTPSRAVVAAGIKALGGLA